MLHCKDGSVMQLHYYISAVVSASLDLTYDEGPSDNQADAVSASLDLKSDGCVFDTS